MPRACSKPTSGYIHDAMSGDQTLFTNAEGIERLWQVSHPLLDAPPEVQLYRVGSWGPPGIADLIAPRSWRLPFERGWRQRQARDPATWPVTGCAP